MTTPRPEPSDLPRLFSLACISDQLPPMVVWGMFFGPEEGAVVTWRSPSGGRQLWLTQNAETARRRLARRGYHVDLVWATPTELEI